MKTALLCGAVIALLSGCTSGGSPGTTPSPASSPPTANTSSASPSTVHGTTWPVVALGDSVPEGAACNCTPYPQLSASDLSVPGLRDISADNLAVGGYTTEDVVRQVMQDTRVIDAVKQSDAIEVEIGANDVGHSAKCGTTAACYATAIPQVEQNLRTIVQRIHDLTAGHPTLVTLLDYWSVWLGGQYARAQGQAYVDAAATVTNDVNTAIKTVAAETGSAYVDLRAAFKGPDYAYDETHYLASDGDHPNAAGHQQIALALEQVIQATLHLPPS
jgi:acyl-CoA thioesterase-1